MDIRVLLIVQEDSAKKRYYEALENCGVHVFVSTSFQDFSQEICGQSFHGIFLDLPTKIKALKKNKDYVYGLLENFPVSHLRINDNTGEVHCFHVGRESACTLTDFIDNECRNFVPRMIRSDVRREIHFNVRLYKTPDRDNPERSITMNVSKGGCFLFSVQDWKIGDSVWIEILELPDSHPIIGSIRHIVKWGESRRIPGVGVEFQRISESLTAELSTL